jgi:hypothetical protein
MMKRGNTDAGRTETDHEYRRRVQDAMDQDKWHGTDRVGARYPDRAQVHDLPKDDTIHIYRTPEGD